MKEQDIVDLYRGFVDSNDAIFLEYGFQIEMPSFSSKTRNNIPCKKPIVNSKQENNIEIFTG